MSEPAIDFDTKQALARLSEVVRSAAARSSGKGRKLKPEEERQIVQGMVELLVRSALPLADIAQGLQDVPARLYAAAFGETWNKMTSDRSKDALQWIEGLPKEAANNVRRFLIPVIAEFDPKSGRTMLPAKPKELDSREERERFAKNWLAQDAHLLANLLAGELVEYEVTRVLRLFLRLALEPAVNSHVRSEVVRIAARGLTEHDLAQAKTGLEPILQGLTEIIRTLPSAEAASINEFLRESTPQMASRLGLAIAPTVLPPSQTDLVEPPNSAGSQAVHGSPHREQSAASAPPVLAEPTKVMEANAERRTPEVTVKMFDPTEVVLALEVRSREYQDSALLFERAASELRAAAALTAAHDMELRSLEARIESLSTDLQNTREELRAQTEQVGDRDASIQNLNQSASELSRRLAEANAATSQLRTVIDAEADAHKQEMELLVQRMAGQTTQQLEEFRNDVARRVSEVLRGTPPLDSVGSVIDGKAILVRVWEIIEALKRKSIPIRLA
jgi:hypothetical protein